MALILVATYRKCREGGVHLGNVYELKNVATQLAFISLIIYHRFTVATLQAGDAVGIVVDIASIKFKKFVYEVIHAGTMHENGIIKTNIS